MTRRICHSFLEGAAESRPAAAWDFAMSGCSASLALSIGGR